jgi:hypothetical protein
MFGARNFVAFCLFLVAIATSGCCERKGYIVRGDFALELNRVSHLLGRYDDYELTPGDCDCAECRSMDAWDSGDGAGTLSGPEPRLHPVPTRPVFAPDRPTPAPTRDAIEPVPTAQSRPFTYGRTTPRNVRPLEPAEAVDLDLNRADRVTRRQPFMQSAETDSRRSSKSVAANRSR